MIFFGFVITFLYIHFRVVSLVDDSGLAETCSKFV